MEPNRTGPFPFVTATERPPVAWPGGERVALWVIPNVEFFPLDESIDGAGPVPGVPGWAMRDYGARVGFSRMLDVMQRHGVPGTVALNAEVCDAYPQLVALAQALGWEFMGHCQSNARPLHRIDPAAERAVVLGALDRIEQATGTRPAGWLGAGLHETWNTLDLLVEGGCDYVADWVNDDQPYLMRAGSGSLVSVPYSMEINDMRQIIRRNLEVEAFEQMTRRQFDVLYREGAHSGRVMAICLHPFIIGVPHRIDALDRMLGYICGHAGVWVTTGAAIARHYRAQVMA